MPKKIFEVTAFAYDKKGRLISVGRNSYTKTHPLQKECAIIGERPQRIYLHAEIDALIRAKRKRVYKLVVIRYNAEGKPVCAKPCSACEVAIKRFGVNIIEHS